MVANDAYIGLYHDFVGDKNESSVIWTDEVNSNIRFDIFLSNQLILVTWLLEVAIKFLMLSPLVRMIIYLCNGPLVVIFSLGFRMFELLTVLWISSIFLSDSLEKFSFNLRIS